MTFNEDPRDISMKYLQEYYLVLYNMSQKLKIEFYFTEAINSTLIDLSVYQASSW